MDKKASDRKSLKGAFKERMITGGVGAIRNLANGRLLIESASDVASKKNRFEFARSSGLCIYPRLQKDWAQFGPDAFVYETLEQLDKPEDQDSMEFADNIKLLEKIWLEKTDSKLLY